MENSNNSIFDSFTRLVESSRTLQKYIGSGVSTTGGFSNAVGPESAAVLLTDGTKKRKKLKKSDASGIQTTINGKKLKMTGLTNKEKDEYLFGDVAIEKSLDYVDGVIEYLEALSSPDLLEDTTSLEKCDLTKTSKLIKGKQGMWRRIKGRPCFICEDGTIHAGPKAFVGKKAATLRDELRAERKKSSK